MIALSQPPIIRIHNVLTEDETLHLIQLAINKINTFDLHDIELQYWHDPVVKRIEKRLARLTMFPEDHGEGSVITKFPSEEEGEETREFDGIDERIYEYKNGTTAYDTITQQGQRIATVIVYLNDVQEGGHTIFPYAGRSDRDAKKLKEKEEFLSNHKHRKMCSMWNVLRVVPKKGDAIFFYDLDTDNKFNTATMYSHCPVRRGSKWILRKRFNIQRKAISFSFYLYLSFLQC